MLVLSLMKRLYVPELLVAARKSPLSENWA
jgi:hypothetical protein